MSKKDSTPSLAKTLLKIIGVGVAGGAVLISGANKAGQKFLNENKKKELPKK